MGPYVLDASTVDCKPAYGGNVYLYFSLDSGDTWEELTILETYNYRTEDFTEVRNIHSIVASVVTLARCTCSHKR